MFKGRVERVSHEGGLLISYSGACPALGSVMVDSSETYIGKVDGVIGNLNDSMVHVAHLDRKANANNMIGIEITIRAKKQRDSRNFGEDRRGSDRRGGNDRRGRDDRGGDNRRNNSNNRDWECPKCQNSNFAFRTECNRCGEPKGSGSSNFQRNDRGSRDNRRGRDDRRGRDERRGRDDRRDNRGNHSNNDWDCPKCNNSNFAFRTECNRCGEPKGQGGSNQRGGNDRRGRGDRRGGDDRRGRENQRRGNDRGNHSDNDWECRECKNSNFSFRTECNRCGAPKGRRERVPSKKWEGNDRRPGDRKEEQTSRPGDWDCPQCGKSNFARRNDCFSCGRSKRVGGPRKGHHRKLKDPLPLHSVKYNRRKRE